MMKTESKKISAWKLGLIVPVMAGIAVVVSCQEQSGQPEIANVSKKDNTIYTKVDNMAEFPGGFPGMANFIGKNLKYPEAARNKNISGKVFVQFVVNQDGFVTDTKVLKGLTAETDNEAMRVVNLFPKLTPATLNGVAVRSTFILPIRFSLE